MTNTMTISMRYTQQEKTTKTAYTCALFHTFRPDTTKHHHRSLRCSCELLPVESCCRNFVKIMNPEDAKRGWQVSTHLCEEFLIPCRTGWWFEPFWKIWVRQLGWWNSQVIWKKKSMFQTTNQRIVVLENDGQPLVSEMVCFQRSAPNHRLQFRMNVLLRGAGKICSSWDYRCGLGASKR